MHIYTVIKPENVIESYETIQDAAKSAGIHRNTLSKFTESGKVYSKRGLTVAKSEVNKSQRTGNAANFKKKSNE